MTLPTDGAEEQRAVFSRSFECALIVLGVDASREDWLTDGEAGVNEQYSEHLLGWHCDELEKLLLG